MSFLYPRIISVRRPRANESVGPQPYSGVTEANEDTIASGLRASIQLNRKGGSPQAGTPSDAYNRNGYDVFIPKSDAALGSILERDVIVDDLANRYQVTGAYWNSFGFNLSVELMQG